MLKDRHCLITGGAGSVGLACARLFLDHGARVTLVDLHPLDGLPDGLAGHEDRVLYLAADVSDVKSTAAYIRGAVDRFGKIDVLMSNAGNFGGVAPIESFPVENFDQVLAVTGGGPVDASETLATQETPSISSARGLIGTAFLPFIR